MAELPEIPDFKYSDINKSVLSNLKIHDNNWSEIKEFLELLLPFFNQIDIEYLIQEVLRNIQTVKIRLDVSHVIAIGNSVVIGNYTVTRTASNEFEIVNNVELEDWDTSQIFVDVVYSVSKQVIRPIIVKNGHILEINFNSNIENDFYIVMF